MTKDAVRADADPVSILCVFGTRPDAIKMAPVLWALGGQSWCRTRVCVTAQHRQMLDPLLELFRIRVNHDLDVMREDQSLTALTARLFDSLGVVFESDRPDWVVVQGDTTTAMVAATVAFYHHAHVAHVEAGLRTKARRSPFPEEMNRRLLGHLADLHLAPTDGARRHLLAEGIEDDRIVVTGNTAIDTLRWTASHAGDTAAHDLHVPADARLILVTTHRRESFGGRLENTCKALRRLAERYGEDLHLVLPVHPNPNVKPLVHRMLGGLPNVHLVPPLPYVALVRLMQRAVFVITDSGGIQEEAPSLGRPVLVLRENTERPEGVAAGVARLVGTDADRIVDEAVRLLEDDVFYRSMAVTTDLYGDGHAGDRIAEALRRHAAVRRSTS